MVFTYPGTLTHDDCLVELADYNEKIRGNQIAPKMTGTTLFYNSGCFEIDDYMVTRKDVKLVLWRKFGPAAYVPDKNIKRILKRQYYDYPQNPNFVMRKRR